VTGTGGAASNLESAHPAESGGGQFHAIWAKRVLRGPMDGANAVAIRAGSDLVGKANQSGRRQVTLLGFGPTSRRTVSHIVCDVYVVIYLEIYIYDLSYMNVLSYFMNRYFSLFK
jgi:hypothetical protein